MMTGKYFVTCFVDGALDEVVSGHRSKETAKRTAARLRRRNFRLRDLGERLLVKSFRVVPAGTFRRMGVNVNTLPGASKNPVSARKAVSA